MSINKLVLKEPQYVSIDEFLSPFNSIIEDFWKDSLGRDYSRFFGVDTIKNQAYPRADIIDYPNKLVIETEIPGLEKKDIRIEFKNDVLSICGEKKFQSNIENGGKVISRELKRSSFKRSWAIDSNKFITDSIGAEFSNGILIITLPKKDEVIDREKGKIIDIK